MPAAPPNAALRSRRGLWLVLVPALVGLFYAWGHFAWYRQTPLGQVPVLDEQENLALAEAIVRGELPKEPFYRAAGYPLVLATLREFGVAAPDLFGTALALGVALHAINAALIAGIALQFFGRTGAAAAGLLAALNPVLVHYATQALDAVPALTLFLAGLALIAPELVGRKSRFAAGRWAAASGCWALAAITRPNYLLPWLILPALAGWLCWGRWRVLGAACTGVVVFAAVAGWQQRVSGEAGFLPWQGAYNLWAANEPGTHGRYYLQRHTPPASLGIINPARADSFYLFHRTNGRPPRDIAELNGYWRGRFWTYVGEQPAAWLGQLLRKTYALLNDWEQYNNKTYAFHRALSPWLRWNPLGWGIFFVVGIAGGVRLATQLPRAAFAVAVVALACAVSIVLFFVSARFRLPLAALAVVLAGGALGEPRFWRGWSARRQLLLAGAVVLAATLTFSRVDGVVDRRPFAEDHALLARAASTVGDYGLAWSEAAAALELRPTQPDARLVAVASYFNLLVQDAANPSEHARWVAVCSGLLAAKDSPPALRAVAALAWWRTGRTAEALEEWRQWREVPAALAARLLARDTTVSAREFAAAAPRDREDALVRIATAAFGFGNTTPEERRAGTEIAERLFGRPRVMAP